MGRHLSRSTRTGALLLWGMCILITACANSLDGRCSEGACDLRSDAGGGRDGGPDAAVDPCIDTPSDPKCLDEGAALFVSAANGNDQNIEATKSKPLKTIQAALAKITSTRRRIYVCEGFYGEDILLSSVHDGLSIFGGLTCDWVAAATAKPVIGASARPFRVGATSALALADLSIEAKNATNGSSVALLVDKGSVTLKRVVLKARDGATADPASTTPFALPAAEELKGMSATGDSGGGSKSVVCPGGATTVGGKGGNRGDDGASGAPGPANGGADSLCNVSIAGAAGGRGNPALPTSEVAKVTVNGFLTASGRAGDNGAPGQGGGGGYGNGGGGGGGGAGGCGGAGGAGGNGGGGSVALAAHLAAVSLFGCRLEAREGGRGGAGVAGQSAGGAVGEGGAPTSACPGGSGGPGGDGGAGSGGAGGSSIGIAFFGKKPVADLETERAIVVGTPGAGGAAASTATGPMGVAERFFESK